MGQLFLLLKPLRLSRDDIIAPPWRIDGIIAPPLQRDDIVAPPWRIDDRVAPPLRIDDVIATSLHIDDIIAPPLRIDGFESTRVERPEHVGKLCVPFEPLRTWHI